MVTKPRPVGNILYFDFHQGIKEEEDESLIFEDVYDPVYREARGALKGTLIAYSLENAIQVSNKMMCLSRIAVGKHFEGYNSVDKDDLACALIRATHKAKLTRIVPEWADRAASLAKRLEDVLWREDVKSKLFFLDPQSREYVASLALLSKNKGVVRPEELETAMYLVLRYEQIKDERYVQEQTNNYFEAIRSAM